MHDTIDVQVLATGLQFPEGPVALDDGSVLVAEIRSGLIKRVWPDGAVTTHADCTGGPNGMAIGPDGDLYVCNNGGNHYPANHFAATGPAADYAGGLIQRVDMRRGEVSTLYSHIGAHKLSSPNDLVFDAEGAMYFTDFGKKHPRHRDHGGIYYALADGSAITELVYPMSAPNGIGLSPDGSKLYVAETEAARVWVFDIERPGKLHKATGHGAHGGRLLCALPGYQRLDSLAIDSAGNICVGTLVTGMITVISPRGEILRQVKFPDSYVTNICFGGADMRTAFVTLSETGHLVATRWDIPGLRLHFNA